MNWITEHYNLGLHLTIGVIYTLINIFLRDMNETADENPMLIFVWIFGWPLFASLLLINKTIKQIKKWTNK